MSDATSVGAAVLASKSVMENAASGKSLKMNCVSEFLVLTLTARILEGHEISEKL